MQRRNLLKAVIVATASAAFFTGVARADDKVIKVGTIAGPEAQIWQVVQKVGKYQFLPT